MIFGKTTKHSLPAFPPGTVSTFYSLCEELDDVSVKGLDSLVSLALEEIQQRAKDNVYIDVSMAEKVAEGCRYLLSIYGGRTGYEKSLIVGAVRYFAVADDPFPDTVFATGLDDDAKVVNYVLEHLGIEDRFIEIG
jgi:hypothetical protein